MRQAATRVLFVALFFCPFVTAAQATTTQATNWFDTEVVPGANTPAGDFVVGPGKFELELAPGETKSFFLSVTNRLGQERSFAIEVEDAVGSADPGKTVDLLGGARGPYTIADYISIPEESFTLEHSRRARIPVTISVPPDAEPGGRYGSVLFNTVANPDSGAGDGDIASQSPVIARIGTLLFLTISGDAEKAGQLVDFTTVPKQTVFQSGPINFGISFENTGSVHLAPAGTLTITNILNEKVGEVELDPWFALPNSVRFREVIWNREVLFGKYTATLALDRGYDDKQDIATVTFWVLPMHYILLIMALVLFLTGARWWYKSRS